MTNHTSHPQFDIVETLERSGSAGNAVKADADGGADTNANADCFLEGHFLSLRPTYIVL